MKEWSPGSTQDTDKYVGFGPSEINYEIPNLPPTFYLTFPIFADTTLTQSNIKFVFCMEYLDILDFWGIVSCVVLLTQYIPYIFLCSPAMINIKSKSFSILKKFMDPEVVSFHLKTNSVVFFCLKSWFPLQLCLLWSDDFICYHLILLVNNSS